MPIAANIIAMWPSTNGSIPSGWTRVTSLDDLYIEGGSSSNSHSTSTAGAANHTHTGGSHSHSLSHTHTGFRLNEKPYPWNLQAAGNATTQASGGHYHGSNSTASSGASGNTGSTSISWGASANNPLFIRMIFVESDGGPAGFADGMVEFFYSGTPPTDWIQHAATADRYIRGATSGADGGGTGGVTGHTHSGSSHSHTIANHTHATFNSANATGVTSTNEGGNSRGASRNHSHPITFDPDSGGQTSGALSPSSNTGGDTPLFHTLLAIEYDAALDDQPVGLIAMWLGTVANIPKGWVLCDGSTGSVSGITSPDLRGRFIKCADAGNDVGTRSGSTSHSHSTNSQTHSTGHTHTYSYGVPSADWYYNNAASLPNYNHSHPTSNASNAGSGVGGTHPLSSQSDARPSLRTTIYLLLDEPQLGGYAGGPSGAGYYGSGVAHF